MEYVVELIFQGVSVLIFVLAVSILGYNIRTLDTLEYQGKQNIYTGTKVMFEQYEKEEHLPNTLTYEEVCCSLMTKLPYDIKINNISIQKDEFDYMLFDFSVLPKTNYQRQYRLNDGVIREVLYISV